MSVSLIALGSLRGANSAVRVQRPSERRSASRSATRALDVMELFGTGKRPLRAVEICKALTMNPSTANQLLKTMVDSGHLLFDARAKTYVPSPRLAEFGSWVVDTYGAGGRLNQLIGDIKSRTGMVVTITTPNDLFMQIIDSAIPQGMTAERGLKVSVFGSAIGSAYLAMLDDGEVLRLADRARFTADQIACILEEVARIRQDGFADGPSGDEAIWSIGLPLPLQGSRVPTVLGLAGPPEQMRSNLAVYRQIMGEAIKRWLVDSP
ncbi:MAG: helix-turn-helix domain-containing protein [Novosphingobium sp.]